MLGHAWSDADILEVLARGLAVVAVVFPILAIGVVLVRLLRRVLTRVWTATSGRPVRRGLAGALALALVAGLGNMWWPREGTYRPIQPYEGGTLTQVAGAARPATAGLSAGSYGRLTTGWAEGKSRPTREKPQLALVLVPRADTGTTTDASTTGSGDGSTEPGDGTPTESWVFPFNKPLEPGEGDNQALSVNTTDNTIRYDVAFALVWVEDDTPALNKNGAYAFASCTNCAAVSIGFQVVLVTGENHVAVPQNISAAVNYNCVNCLTYALATQLFVTLDGPLSDASLQQLGTLWQAIAKFGTDIATVPLSEIRDQLTAYETQILDIIEADKLAASQGESAAETRDPEEPGNQAVPTEEASPSAADPETPPADEGTGDGTPSQPGTEEADSTGTDTGSDSTGQAPPEEAPVEEPEPSPAAEPTTGP